MALGRLVGSDASAPIAVSASDAMVPSTTEGLRQADVSHPSLHRSALGDRII
jgi:hypothetical protein